jgi:hypothetical protein
MEEWDRPQNSFAAAQAQVDLMQPIASIFFITHPDRVADALLGTSMILDAVIRSTDSA